MAAAASVGTFTIHIDSLAEAYSGILGTGRRPTAAETLRAATFYVMAVMLWVAHASSVSDRRMVGCTGQRAGASRDIV
jgi:hypothetical protein